MIIDSINRKYLEAKCNANIKGDKLGFMVISIEDWVKLRNCLEYRMGAYNLNTPKTMRMYGLRVLKTEDLQTGEIIFF